jgi:hypothetical protein
MADNPGVIVVVAQCEDRNKAQESFKNDPEVQVFIATARGARRRPRQRRHSQLQNRRPH